MNIVKAGKREIDLNVMDYLTETTLLSHANKKYPFQLSFEEIYNELVITGIHPSLSILCETIHEENIQIITNYCLSAGYLMSTIDSAIFMYWEQISSIVESNVETELINKMGPAYVKYFGSSITERDINPAQIILIPEMV